MSHRCSGGDLGRNGGDLGELGRFTPTGRVSGNISGVSCLRVQWVSPPLGDSIECGLARVIKVVRPVNKISSQHNRAWSVPSLRRRGPWSPGGYILRLRSGTMCVSET